MKRKSPDTSSEAAPIIKPPSINMASSLQKLSMDAILSTQNQVDASSLLELADLHLVQLLLASKEKNKNTEEALANVREELADVKEELANVRRKRYIVDPPSGQDRVPYEQYAVMKAIRLKWSVDVAKDRSDAGEEISVSNLINSGLTLLYSVKDRMHVLISYSEFDRVHSDTVKKHIVDNTTQTSG